MRISEAAPARGKLSRPAAHRSRSVRTPGADMDSKRRA
eukprot:CAMPEP_0179339932 /NCGR_PEP_ID=MMETSP0797-20121207/68995_1 /TAXON_ID=47934 /ORGANISM="Dinophysis acuminata, Strain DAEP01" /LENGTH=37 /DNA_ID= /DNA_START= /DNA_END= /DNA_ORIENTATION=